MSLTADYERWYRNRRSEDGRAREESEASLGGERQVLVEALCVAQGLVLSVLQRGPIEDFVLKVKIAIAQRSHNLIWSSWEEVLVGRYDTATEHWRSIFESADFLKAIQLNSDLASPWFEGRLKVESARRTIAKGYRDLGATERSKLFQSQQAENDKIIQPFSHVSTESTIATIPIMEDESGNQAYRVGGAVSPRMARHMTLYLAHEAIVLLAACAFAFNGIEAVDKLWDEAGQDVAQRGTAQITTLAAKLGVFDPTRSAGEDVMRV